MLAPWATRRRQDLLELVDRLNTTIAELMRADLSADLRLSALASECGYSRTYFLQMFRNATVIRRIGIFFILG